MIPPQGRPHTHKVSTPPTPASPPARLTGATSGARARAALYSVQPVDPLPSPDPHYVRGDGQGSGSRRLQPVRRSTPRPRAARGPVRSEAPSARGVLLPRGRKARFGPRSRRRAPPCTRAFRTQSPLAAAPRSGPGGRRGSPRPSGNASAPTGCGELGRGLGRVSRETIVDPGTCAWQENCRLQRRLSRGILPFPRGLPPKSAPRGEE